VATGVAAGDSSTSAVSASVPRTGHHSTTGEARVATTATAMSTANGNRPAGPFATPATVRHDRTPTVTATIAAATARW
jgi:hypothetical protein